MNELNNEPSINFEMPSVYPVMAKLDLEAYRAWCKTYGLEPQLDVETVAIYEFFQVYQEKPGTVRPETTTYGRTWVREKRKGMFGGEYNTSTSCDIPERFLSVTV